VSHLAKVVYEILATPLAYAVVGWLKKTEQIDTFDTGVRFNPFALSFRIPRKSPAADAVAG